jgi:hypothetical protein
MRIAQAHGLDPVMMTGEFKVFQRGFGVERFLHPPEEHPLPIKTDSTCTPKSFCTVNVARIRVLSS